MTPDLIIAIAWSIAVLLQLRFWIFSRTHHTPPVGHPAVSVVVCAHRFDAAFRNTIRSLQSQTYQEYEVVIVNDGPDPDIASWLGGLNWSRLQVIDFDMHSKTTPGKKMALTAGIAAARYPWILLTDADCLPGYRWISAMMAGRTENASMVLGFGPFERRRGVLNLLQRFDNLLIAVQYFGAAMRNAAYMGVGRNIGYTRKLFEAVGGFASHADRISGDDDLFVQSAVKAGGVTISTDPESFVYSDAPSTLAQWLHQKRRHLSAGSAYSIKAILRTTGFALTWLVFWIGLPVVIISGMPWLIPVMIICLFWVLFAVQALRFCEPDLIRWFPVLALFYCLLIFSFAVLLNFKQPSRWSIS